MPRYGANVRTQSTNGFSPKNNGLLLGTAISLLGFVCRGLACLLALLRPHRRSKIRTRCRLNGANLAVQLVYIPVSGRQDLWRERADTPWVQRVYGALLLKIHSCSCQHSPSGFSV